MYLLLLNYFYIDYLIYFSPFYMFNNSKFFLSFFHLNLLDKGFYITYYEGSPYLIFRIDFIFVLLLIFNLLPNLA